MIIPTSEYDPMFADDGIPFRDKMVAYIEREFSDILGPRKGFLKTNEGLNILSRIYSPVPSEQQREGKAA